MSVESLIEIICGFDPMKKFSALVIMIFLIFLHLLWVMALPIFEYIEYYEQGNDLWAHTHPTICETIFIRLF